MADPAMMQDFETLKGRYFDPLCQRLGVIPGEPVVGQGFAKVSADTGAVRVYFEYERGLCSFSIGAISESEPLCSVEEIAERFPRLRLISGGLQRLSLEEQASFLESRWDDLQVMFSAEHLLETRKWRSAAVAAYTRKFTDKN